MSEQDPQGLKMLARTVTFYKRGMPLSDEIGGFTVLAPEEDDLDAATQSGVYEWLVMNGYTEDDVDYTVY